MPTRGVLSVVASAGGLTSADVADLTSKPSMAFFQISGFVLTSASGASPLVRLTFAPAFNRRFTSIAEVAPLYGKRHPFGPLALTDNTGFGAAAAELTSKTSMAFFQISGFVLTSASGASPLVRLTFAPAFNRRFTRDLEEGH